MFIVNRLALASYQGSDEHIIGWIAEEVLNESKRHSQGFWTEVVGRRGAYIGGGCFSVVEWRRRGFSGHQDAADGNFGNLAQGALADVPIRRDYAHGHLRVWEKTCVCQVKGT